MYKNVYINKFIYKNKQVPSLADNKYFQINSFARYGVQKT